MSGAQRALGFALIGAGFALSISVDVPERVRATVALALVMSGTVALLVWADRLLAAVAVDELAVRRMRRFDLDGGIGGGQGA